MSTPVVEDDSFQQKARELRQQTCAGLMDCRQALSRCDGDLVKAKVWLHESTGTIQMQAADKARVDMVRSLFRVSPGVTLRDCERALQHSGWDLSKAERRLREHEVL